MTKRSKTADRTLALDAYVTALRLWAENAKENIRPEAEALAKAAQRDIEALAVKRVQRMFGRERPKWDLKVKGGRRQVMAEVSEHYFHGHYPPNISAEENVTVMFGDISMGVTLKVPDSIRNKWNPKLKAMFERYQAINALPSPSRGTVRDWQRSAVRELMTDNPQLVEAIISTIGEAAAKTKPDHWTAKVARAGQRTKRAPSRKR